MSTSWKNWIKSKTKKSISELKGFEIIFPKKILKTNSENRLYVCAYVYVHVVVTI